MPLPFAGLTEDQLNRAKDIISSLQVFFGIPCAPEPTSQPIMITDTSCRQSVIIVGCSMLRSPRFEAEFLLLETADRQRLNTVPITLPQVFYLSQQVTGLRLLCKRLV